MRKIALSLAAAGAALLAASPAAAQYYHAPVGNARGYNSSYGMFRSLQVRVDNIQRQIDRLDRRDRIGENSADRLRDEARRIEQRLHQRSRGGLDPREAGDLTYRVQRLEQRVQIALNNRYDGRRNRGW